MLNVNIISFDNLCSDCIKWRILMDKTVKLLIIIVVALVAILGVATGFILQSYMSNSNKNVAMANQTNNSTNSSVNKTQPIVINKTTTTIKTQSNIITPSQAMDAVNKADIGTQYYALSAKLDSPDGVYLVLTYDGINHKQMGYVGVNMTTGELME